MHHRLRDELGSVVTAQHDRSAPLSDECFQVVDESVCGDGSLDQTADAFSGVFIHDRADLQSFALLTNIELEIHCPHHIGSIRRRSVDCGGADPLASTTLGHSKSFFTPQTLDFLVIDLLGQVSGQSAPECGAYVEYLLIVGSILPENSGFMDS